MRRVREKFNRECTYCNKVVQLPFYRLNRFRFCSRQCRHDSMKESIPWNKGMRGLHLSPLSEFKKGMIPWNKGTKHFCLECGKSVWRKSDRCKECFAKWKFQINENHPRWKGGITPANKRIRSTVNWAKWRASVFARDSFTCKECGVRGGFLEPHHIIPIRSDKNKLFDINNGITLCRPCHQKTIWKESNFVEKYSRLVAA